MYTGSCCCGDETKNDVIKKKDKRMRTTESTVQINPYPANVDNMVSSYQC